VLRRVEPLPDWPAYARACQVLDGDPAL
jgi:hypothetical protein